MATPTQTFVPIEEVRDGIAIMRDGSLRAIVMTSTVNFALKSTDEQAAILAQFQNFLNTVDFSLQLYVQSRELDINPYIQLLRSREEEQSNDLMKVQLREYIGFIQAFTEEVDIMTKSFFVVVSYTPAAINVKKGIGTLLGTRRKQTEELTAEQARFEEARTQLEQRIAVVEQGLNRVGIRTITLGTNEVVDLFYHLFNPGEKSSAPQR